MSKILLIQDLLDSRKRKEKELQFYSQKLYELEASMGLIRSEINLTNKILAMIKKEELPEIKSRDE